MKNTKRKGFNFFRSYFDVYNELPEEDKLPFIDALLMKQFLGIDPEGLKGMSKFAWISQVHSITTQVKGYEDKTGCKLTPTEGGGITPTEQVKGKEQVIEEVKVIEKEEIKVYDKSIHDCFDNCLNYFEEHLHPKSNKLKNNWLDTIDKLKRIEGVPFNHIEKIVKGIRGDPFWNKNFMSLPKLRKKNKDELMYIVVFNEHLKSKTNGNTKSRRQQHAEKIAKRDNSNAGV